MKKFRAILQLVVDLIFIFGEQNLGFFGNSLKKIWQKYHCSTKIAYLITVMSCYRWPNKTC